MRSISFLSKLTIFGFLLSTLPVLFIGLFSYTTSSSEIQNHVNKGKTQLLVQINANVDQILKTVNHTLNQVINSTVLKSALNNSLSVNDFKLYDQLRNEIRHMQSFDTKLEDVVFLNEQRGWLIKNSGLYRLQDYKYADELTSLLHQSEDSTWGLHRTQWFYSDENENSGTCEYVVSLIKKLPVADISPTGMMMANIPACSLQELLQNGSDQADTIFVLDEQSRILLHPDFSLIGQPASALGFNHERTLEATSGQFQDNIRQHAYSVTYYRSPYSGWIYVSLTSIASLTKESNKIGLYTLFVSLAMLLVTMLIAWIGSRRMYSPIERLLKQIEDRLPGEQRRNSNEFQVISEKFHHLFQSNSRLEGEMHRHLDQARSFFLIRAYQGHIRQSELTEQLKRYGYGTQMSTWRHMVVFTLQIDMLDNTRYDKQDMDLLFFALHNMIEELVAKERRLVPVTIDQTVVLLYGMAADSLSTFNTALYEATEHLQINIERFLHLKVSIGISLPFETIGQMSIAYREGLDALKHRLKLGEGIIIQYEHINSGKHYLKMNYPKHTETELIDAIKLADPDKASDALRGFLGPVFELEMTPQEYQIPLARLLNNLLMVAQESGIRLSQIRPEGGALFEELIKLNTVPEIEDWFRTQVIEPLIRVFRDRQQSQYQNISEKVIDLVQQLYDTDLSLEQCASRLNYNANYLSSVFRKETNVSFSEYVAAYRFNMAKKWLADSDMPVKDIAARLRYNNPQNFIRSFRKQEGMTPGQYRERHTRVRG